MYQLPVPVTQEMVILNVRHHCNVGYKAVILLACRAVERKAVKGIVWAHTDSGEYFLNPYKL
jgi:hypothetical protein